MDKLLSLTKNSKREVTITLPSEQLNTTTRWFDSYLARSVITFNLTLTLYEVKLQNIIVFNFKGDEDSINKFIKSVEGLY